MLDLGFPIGDRSGDEEKTALHAAAYAGSAEVVRLLLANGADVEARDGRWHSNPLDWAVVGSGERPDINPAPDHVAVVRALLDAGSSTDDVDASPEAQKPPSPEVARLFGG